jgi:hypothetical protein
MKKKIFIGIAMSLFAVATVFNMNISEQNDDGDVSLEAIEVMAQAASEGGSGGGSIGGWRDIACWEAYGTCFACNGSTFWGFVGPGGC